MQADLFIIKLALLEHETTWILFLDSDETGLALNTAALIVAHNHPSGVEEPSPTEIAITEQLKHALGLIYVKMLDHFFVSADNISLLADHSLC